MLLVGAALLAVFFAECASRAARTFYLQELESVGVSSESSSARLSYSRELARRSPVLGIAGTDPKSLLDATDSLEQTVRLLSAKQQTKDEAHSIFSLYPINFLRKLARAESARIAFIASGSALDEHHYRAAVSEAANAMRADGDLFSAQLQAYLNSRDQFTIETLGGTIQKTDFNVALETLSQRTRELRTRIDKREQCLRGAIRSCEIGALSITLTIPSVQKLSSQQATQAAEIQNLFSEVHGKGSRLGESVVLAKSTCAALLPPPYLYSVYLDPPKSAPPFLFIGDIVFVKAPGSNGKVVQYLHNTYGVDRLYVNSSKFYVCPDVLEDLGTATALLQIKAYAQKQDSPAAQSFLETAQEGVPEVAATQYVKDALESGIEKDQLLQQYLTLTEKSAGLHLLVADIADTLRADLALSAKGVPFDFSAKKLFISHAAFPSLFLMHNPSVGSSTLTLKSAGTTTAFFKEAELYTTLRNSLSRFTIITELRRFFQYERAGR